MATVELKNVYKIFGEVIAVNDFSLKIEDKEFIVFVGPSGCGKTTTLRMIAGLESITAGEIYIGDNLVNYVEPKNRDIAMVFQNYALYPHMTVYKNMAFSLKLRKFPFEVEVEDKKTHQKTKKIIYRKLKKDEIHEKVMAAARMLEIEDYLSRKPKALSGGQRQRVAIGRAIVRNPKVFLMDEPLSNLDAKLRNQMRAELILLRKRINTTFIYVTHDQTEAMTLGDRIVIMKDGLVQQIGTPDEVFYQPSNLFVAGFIGTPQMNFLDAHLSLNRKKVIINGVPLPISDDLVSQFIEKSIADCDFVLGIRPEHMKISFKPKKDALEGEILVTESMGSMIHLHINAGQMKNIIIIVPTIEIKKEELERLKAGEKIYFYWADELAHYFSKETTMNLLK
ncbi:MAG: ATP-binding cassette domain-containing protein [Coprobacillus sp.]|nr:ATP-binding cassette domain-containing protein [Coprobacillus sp.]